MSSKAHTQVAKAESSNQVCARSPVLLRRRTALLDPNDSKETVLRGYNYFRQSAPSVPAALNRGHDFAHIPVSHTTRVPIQPKLRINEPGDRYEQEADRVAEQVMHTLEPIVQLKPG